MPRKVYTEQFKRDAVAMFESNPDTSMRKVAEELGPEDTLVTELSSVQLLGAPTIHPHIAIAKDEDAASPVEKLADAERIRQLERENKRLREERDILRKAAKYFAEETTW